MVTHPWVALPSRIPVQFDQRPEREKNKLEPAIECHRYDSGRCCRTLRWGESVPLETFVGPAPQSESGLATAVERITEGHVGDALTASILTLELELGEPPFLAPNSTSTGHSTRRRTFASVSCDTAGISSQEAVTRLPVSTNHYRGDPLAVQPNRRLVHTTESHKRVSS